MDWYQCKVESDEVAKANGFEDSEVKHDMEAASCSSSDSMALLHIGKKIDRTLSGLQPVHAEHNKPIFNFIYTLKHKE